MIQIERYKRSDGTVPFTEWFDGQLRDPRARAQVAARLYRISIGNLGDIVALGEGVFELPIHSGPGYRVYFGRQGSSFVLLLSGGGKKSQSADIRTAKVYWQDWKKRLSR